MKKVIVIVSVALLLAAAAVVSFVVLNKAQDTQVAVQDYWPDAEWRTSTPEQQGMDSGLLADMINTAAESKADIDSITIIRRGHIVSETYFYPYSKGFKHSVFSCTKSFTSALAGAAIKDGFIKSVGDKVLDYFAALDIENVDERKQQMTIGELLSMTSGLDWKFYYDISSDEMLQSGNWSKYTLDLPMREEPGKTFNYSDGAAHVASALVQKATGKSTYEYFQDKLGSLGIRDCYWSVSPEKVSTGHTGLFMQPDDLAKLGYLYLKNGNWNGEQLLSKEWIEESTKQHTTADWTPYLPGYGYYWWITSFGGYAAVGHGGNFIFVVPELDLVVVFTGGIYDNSMIFYPCELMDKYIIPSVKSDVPLRENKEAFALLGKATGAVEDAPLPKIAYLPKTALKVSGKSYSINDTSAVFNFKEGSAEFTFELNTVMYTAGLDGAFRVMDAGKEGSLPEHNHVAVRGSWLDEHTLRIELHGLEDGYRNVYTVRFEGDTLTATIDSNFWPDQTVKGYFAQ